MAEPTDEQLLAEAERLKQEDAKKRLPIWPFFYCVLPILLALGLIVFVNRPSNNDGRQNKTNAVPDLGAQGRPLVKPPADGEKPTDSPTDGVKEPAKAGDKIGKADGSKDGEKQPDSPVEAKPVSDFEIEIAIRNVQSGVKNNNWRQVETGQHWLRDNRNNGPINERITAALTSEQNARTRLALFRAFVYDEPELAWAMTVYRSKTAKFMGTDDNLTEGEADELAAYFRVLISTQPPTADVLQTATTVLKNEKPDWLIGEIVLRLRKLATDVFVERKHEFVQEDRKPFRDVLTEARELLKRGTAAEATREELFLEWAACAESVESLFVETEQPAMLRYLALLLKIQPASAVGGPVPWFRMRQEPDYRVRLIQSLRDVLSGTDTQLKTNTLTALGPSGLVRGEDQPEVRKMIDAGLARKDANYPDYLALLGRMPMKATDYDLLRAAANDATPEVARGAIKGLKDAPAGEAADVRLKEILNEGTNDGVKADAFAALIERNPRDAQKLVDEYIDPVKPVTLRVVAVAHVPAKDVDRLQNLAEDEQLKVRQAAINRLGALKDKKLLSFLKRVSTHDTSPVLRQLAAKYAAELE